MRDLTQMESVSAPHPLLHQPQGTPDIIETTGGDMCLNLCEAAPGVLSVMEFPSVLGRCAHRPVFADIRCGTTHIFTLGDDGTLRLEMSAEDDGTVVTRDMTFGKIAPGGCRMARAGDFIIISDSGGCLHYMQWNSLRAEYVWLGRMPSMPEVTAVAAIHPAHHATVPAVVFPDPIADMRAGVPDDVARAVDKAVTETLLRLRADTAAGGYWTAPLLVRYAIRLWDGTLLHLSAPRLVAPCGFADYRLTQLPLSGTPGAFTGTAQTQVQMPAFRLNVSADTGGMAVWSEVASHIEIWVSREVDITDPDNTTGTVRYSAAGGTPLLRVSSPFASEDEMTRRLLGADWLRVATIPCSAGTAAVTIVRPSETSDMIMDATAGIAREITHATAIAGHGGFLHMAGFTRALPAPPLPAGTPDAVQTATVTVCVTLSSVRGDLTAVSSGEVTADDGLIMPLLWYPDAGAVSMTICMSYADGRMFERTWSLVPMPGENAAYAPFDSPDPFTLLPVTKSSPLPASSPGEYIDGTVMTMRRGNPFVTRASTPSAGGHITHICAQQSGGGAYTRQYLYLFSDTGIVALTHDMEGHHTNCRPVSRQQVSSPSRIAQSDNGVWALSDRGTLLRLSDSKVMRILYGLDTHCSLGADDITGKLWLVPDPDSARTRSILVSTESVSDVTAVTSDFTPALMLPCGVRLLHVLPHATGHNRVWEIAAMTEAGDSGQQMEAEWLSSVIVLDKGGLTEAVIRMTAASDSAFSVEVLALGPRSGISCRDTSGVLLASAHVSGETGHEIRIPFLLPDPALYPRISANRLRIRMKGRWNNLTAFGFRTCD